MPLVQYFKQNAADCGLWKIEEDAVFFQANIPYVSPATHPEKQLQQLASRMVLASLYPDFPFEGVTVNAAGKPVLNDDRLHFSLSHCKGFAAGIVSEKGPVGIDVEVISDRVMKIEKKFLNTHELELLGQVDQHLRSSYATLLWSIKETVYKYWGRGGVDFAQEMLVTVVNFSDQGIARVVFRKQDAYPLEVQFLRYDQVWLSWICPH